MIRFLIFILLSGEALSATYYMGRGVWRRTRDEDRNPYKVETPTEKDKKRAEEWEAFKSERAKKIKARSNKHNFKFGRGEGYGCGQVDTCRWEMGAGYGCGTMKYISACKEEVLKMWSDEGKKRANAKK